MSAVVDKNATVLELETRGANTDIKAADKKMGVNKKLIVCAIGIFVCYFYYGILQEKITKGKYGEGEKREKFVYTLSLVFIQCIVNVLAAYAGTKYMQKKVDTTPTKYYVACSLTYLGAMLASNHALQHVSYPTQVLGKTIKPIPVMILGVLIAKKRYPLVKYLFVILIVLGVAMFMYKDDKAAKADKHELGIGEILLLVSLTLDGLTGASQDKMRSEYSTQAYSMMFFVNLFSVLWLFIGLIVTGEGLLFLSFASRFPVVWFNMLAFSLASALGQIFIFTTVTSFGPLTCSIVTTTRKFFTILTSVLLFQNPMSGKQWIGTVLVFIGLGFDSVYGKEKKTKK